MSSRREEERNEKIIRGLLKLPPNRRCINCNGLGPQYVCTNFWTFVCTACSGIHREFTHRVKSVSMAKFTAQEVEALQSGGNQRARELFLKNWDMQIMKLPDSSYPDKIREFIKIVYLEKKYSGRPFDKPPRDLQDLKSHEDYRRASSYHSFSQSPPYDHQYEDRRYGKQKIMLTRKPGSDHGHYEGNIPNVLYSPGRSRGHVYDDRFAIESASSRISDYSLSSAGDFLRSSDQSPSTFSEPSTQRSSSLGSFWSFDSNSLHSKSANSGVSVGTVFQPKQPSVSQQQPVKPTIAAPEISATQPTAMIDLFSPRFSRQQNIETAVDLFVDFSNQNCAFVSHNKAAPVSSSTNEGWAVFDTVQVAPDIDTSKGLSSMTSPCLKKTDETFHSFSTTQGTSKLFSAQKLSAHGEVISSSNQWHLGFTEIQNVADSTNTPAFNGPSIFGVQHTEMMLPKVLKENGSQFPVMQDENPLIKLSSVRMPSVVPPKEVSSAQEWKSTNPFDLSYDLDAGANNMFLDMSSLHGALPNPQLPSAFLDDLSSQPWFQQNSASTYTVPQAGIPYAVGQVSSSQLPTCIIASQDSAPSSCNPFA